jgi:quercetin dioxygenase-like cupin family protein
VEAAAYKSAAAGEQLPFQGVARHELFGGPGAPGGFDMRYFEIAPHGYSSRERHAHPHALIAARGEGRLVIDGEEMVLRPFDVAHVPSHGVHQLRNEDPAEPFGFFCIVDRARDRPAPPP